MNIEIIVIVSIILIAVYQFISIKILEKKIEYLKDDVRSLKGETARLNINIPIIHNEMKAKTSKISSSLKQLESDVVESLEGLNEIIGELIEKTNPSKK